MQSGGNQKSAAQLQACQREFAKGRCRYERRFKVEPYSNGYAQVIQSHRQKNVESWLSADSVLSDCYKVRSQVSVKVPPKQEETIAFHEAIFY